MLKQKNTIDMIVLTLKKTSILENQNTMALLTIPNAQLTFEKNHEYDKIFEVKKNTKTLNEVKCSPLTCSIKDCGIEHGLTICNKDNWETP